MLRPGRASPGVAPGAVVTPAGTADRGRTVQRDPVRILLIHNWYRERGGEDTVVLTEIDLLRQDGHEVTVFDADSSTITTLAQKVSVALTMAYSTGVRQRVREELERVQPDIVHVHNVFPLLTPSVFDACAAAEVPVVLTLHNFRLLCPAATCMRNGHPCVLCAETTVLNAVRYRCYRGSIPASSAAAWMVALSRYRGSFEAHVDRFVALSEFGRRLFVRAGLPADRIDVKPDAVRDPFPDGSPPAGAERGRHALFLGRLVPEKGVITMLRAWRHVPIPLRVAGAGPLDARVRAAEAASGGRIRYLGFLPQKQVSEELRTASFVVVPSEWYEGFGVVIAEAFAHGVPVLASRLGSIDEVVADGRTGLLFSPGDSVDLAAKARWLARHPAQREAMGRVARREFEQKYTLQRNYELLMAIYDRALATRRDRLAAAHPADGG